MADLDWAVSPLCAERGQAREGTHDAIQGLSFRNMMRGAVSKWAAKEEAAQMLYGKLGVLLASVLWLNAQGARQSWDLRTVLA